MKQFRYMLAFCLSLGVMFATEYLIGRFSVWSGGWISSLVMPLYAPNELVYEICFTVALCFAVICCTFSTIKPTLRKTLILWGGIAVLSILWSVVLFVWQSMYGALGISAIILVGLAVLLHYYAHHTRELWLALIPPLTWYAYLFIFCFGLCILN